MVLRGTSSARWRVPAVVPGGVAMDQRRMSNAVISRRSFLRIVAQGGTVALVAVCAAGMLATPTMAASPRQVAQQQGLPATGKRNNVARERTLICEFVSGRNANPEVFNPF